MKEIVNREVVRLLEIIRQARESNKTVVEIPASQTLIEAIGVLQDEGYDIGFDNDTYIIAV